MIFYFVRHGQTEANRMRLLAGSGLDYDLNEEGQAQAGRLALMVAQVSPPPTRLFASQLKRAQQTAQALSAHLKLEVEIRPYWGEWDLGEWEGQPSGNLLQFMLSEGEPKEGESRKVFYARIRQAFEASLAHEEPFMVVSHGGVWMALQDILQVERFRVANCDLVKVEKKGSAWHAELLHRVEIPR